jgi:hypothetical protein
MYNPSLVVLVSSGWMSTGIWRKKEVSVTSGREKEAKTHLESVD